MSRYVGGVGRVLNIDDLRARGIRYSRVHLSRLVKSGQFPAPIKLSQNRIMWPESEIDAWLQAKIEARDADKRPKAA